MKLKAYAKINLFLEINNKREDGYHNITSVFQKIDLFDEIELSSRPKKEIKLILEGIKVDSGRNNIVYKAASLIQKISGVNSGVTIKLKKNIPVGAGLGGGSSDAAAVIKGLSKFWHLNWSIRKLKKIGLSIGADVPFFIQDKDICLVKGIGDRIQGLLFKPIFNLVLVYPNINVNTGLVYKKLSFELTKRTKNCSIRKLYNIKNGSLSWQKFLFNRLETSCFKLFPKINSLKKHLLSYEVEGVMMSGSGSCIYAILSNKNLANKIKKDIELLGYTVWILKSK